MFKGEIITSAVVFFGALYLYFESMKFEGHEVYGKLGPAYWPKFLLICLMALSFLVAVDAFRERKKRDSEKEETSKADSGKVRFFFAIGFIVLYLILMQIFGFIILTPLFLIAFMYLLGERKKIWIFGVPIGITVLIVWVFTKAMYVPLPRGQSIFLDFSHLFY
ncbi:MAG: tripartite tricarboxylate transporter TctB family protein [Thermodesulfobacteriota bacterium]|nr:tripartite tricarboxylate transporter TctB family protein [Thermodesulfobacteriota bacterium]